jgi:hypothetical protein
VIRGAGPYTLPGLRRICALISAGPFNQKPDLASIYAQVDRERAAKARAAAPGDGALAKVSPEERAHAAMRKALASPVIWR